MNCILLVLAPSSVSPSSVTSMKKFVSFIVSKVHPEDRQKLAIVINSHLHRLAEAGVLCGELDEDAFQQQQRKMIIKSFCGVSKLLILVMDVSASKAGSQSASNHVLACKVTLLCRQRQ